MIVRELVTVLSYRHDTRGMNAYERSLSSMPRAARDATRRTESVLGKFSNQARRLLNMSLKIHGINRAKSELDSVSSSLKGVGNTLKALTAGYLGVQGIKQFSSFISGAAGEYETGMMRLNTLVGEKKSGNVLKQLRGMAAKTPYELPEILDLFTSLQGSGYELMDRKSGRLYLDRMIAIGDASAIAGKPLSEMKDMILGLGKGLPNMFDNFSGAGFAGAKVEGGSIVGELVNSRAGTSRKFTLDPTDKKAIIDLIVGQGKIAGVAGGMEKLAKTLPGMLSTASDTIKSFGVEIWEGGLKYPVKSLMADLQKWADETMPNLGKSIGQFFNAGAERLSVWFYKVLDFAKASQPYLKPLGVALAMVASHMIGLKVLGSFMEGGKMFALLGFLTKFGKGIMGFVALARMAGPLATIGTIFTSIGAALMPLVIGGAILAVVAGLSYLGYKVWDYWKNGEAALDGIREKYPMLAEGIQSFADALKLWWPELSRSAGIIKDGLVWGLQIVGNVSLWWLKTISLPLLGALLQSLGWVLEKLKTAYDYYMPMLANAFHSVKDAAVGAFNYLLEKMPWLKSIVEAISGGMSSMFGGASGPDSPIDTAMSNNSIVSTALRFVSSGQADRFAKSADKNNGFFTKELFRTGVACAQTTEEILRLAGASKEVLGAMNASAPGSYNNLKNKKLATEVTQPQAGDIFYYVGPKGIQHTGIYAGNGKIIDAANSRGKEIGMGQRVVHRNIPAQFQGNMKFLRLKSTQLDGASNNANVTINQDFHGQTDPKKAGKAATDGTTSALHKAGINAPKQAVCK